MGKKEYFEKAILIDSTGSFWYISRSNMTGLGFTYWKMGQREKGRKILTRSLELNRSQLEEKSEWAGIPYDIAAIHAIWGKKEEAYNWLLDAIAGGWMNHRLSLRDPLLENLHKDERFKEIVREVKVNLDEQRRKVGIY